MLWYGPLSCCAGECDQNMVDIDADVGAWAHQDPPGARTQPGRMSTAAECTGCRDADRRQVTTEIHTLRLGDCSSLRDLMKQHREQELLMWLAKESQVTIDKCQQPLGIGVVIDQGMQRETLRVIGLKSGAVLDWNWRHPDMKVMVGDIITRVNQIEGCPSSMLAELQTSPRLELTLIRPFKDHSVDHVHKLDKSERTTHSSVRPSVPREEDLVPGWAEDEDSLEGEHTGAETQDAAALGEVAEEGDDRDTEAFLDSAPASEREPGTPCEEMWNK